MTSHASRRQFLRTAGALAAVGAGTPIAINLAAMASAAAQSAPDYRALVCLSLGGGNDHLSTYVPYDAPSYGAYQLQRGGLAIDRTTLLPLTSTSAQSGRQIGMNPALSGIKALYDAQRAAVIAAVGPLMAPTTKTAINNGSAALPRLLGSHLDQSNTWQSLAPSNPYGWGGRFGDLLAASNGHAAFTTMSATGGYSLLLVGAQTSFFTVSEGGAPALFFDAGSTRDHVLTRSSQRTNLLERAYAQTHEVLRDGAQALGSAILPETTFPVAPGGGQNATAQQLLTVARTIGAYAALGMKRQIFYVELGGFDTHSSQATRHAALMTQLNDAVSYFDTLMGQLNLRNQVTLFTTSEFGRTYNVNGDGTDHGWGSHHLVVGGAVRGQNIYGTLPAMDPNGPDFVDGASMIPTTSVEQYAATLGAWFGVSTTDLATIFPNLGAFATPTLAFLG